MTSPGEQRASSMKVLFRKWFRSMIFDVTELDSGLGYAAG